MDIRSLAMNSEGGYTLSNSLEVFPSQRFGVYTWRYKGLHTTQIHPVQVVTGRFRVAEGREPPLCPEEREEESAFARC